LRNCVKKKERASAGDVEEAGVVEGEGRERTSIFEQGRL